MTETQLEDVTITAAVQDGRICRSEGHYLRLYIAGELGYIGQDEHAEAERIVKKISDSTSGPKE